MRSLTTTELSANLEDLLDHVNDDREPVTIHRSGGKGIVLLDADDYASMVETLFLLRHPTNAERLQRGMASLAAAASSRTMSRARRAPVPSPGPPIRSAR